MKRISLIGSIVADTAVRPLDQLPAWGAALNVGSVSNHLGGNGAGAALAAARLGAPVMLAGAVGDDSAGAAALALLASTGVDVSGVRTLPGSPSAQTVALISSSGDRLFLQQPGASAQFGLDDIDFSGPIDLFHYASPFNLTALRPSAAQVIERARDCGAAVSLDVDWDPQGEWLDLLAPLCPALDYLFLNRQEAKQLSGLDDPDAVCAFFRRLGTAVVILKRGADGCRVVSASEDFEQPACPAEVVDTTGAGDCFCGAFLAALARDFTLRDCAALAAAAAACSVESVGNGEGLPDLETALRRAKSALA